MDLVIFDDALLHLVRISRVLGMPRGNMMLVGVGGSGKQSLTHFAELHGFRAVPDRLNEAIQPLHIFRRFEIDVQDGRAAAKKATFIFTDSQIKDENFLELLNSLLMTGKFPACSRRTSCKSWPRTFSNMRPSRRTRPNH